MGSAFYDQLPLVDQEYPSLLVHALKHLFKKVEKRSHCHCNMTNSSNISKIVWDLWWTHQEHWPCDLHRRTNMDKHTCTVYRCTSRVTLTSAAGTEVQDNHPCFLFFWKWNYVKGNTAGTAQKSEQSCNASSQHIVIRGLQTRCHCPVLNNKLNNKIWITILTFFFTYKVDKHIGIFQIFKGKGKTRQLYI